MVSYTRTTLYLKSTSIDRRWLDTRAALHRNIYCGSTSLNFIVAFELRVRDCELAEIHCSLRRIVRKSNENGKKCSLDPSGTWSHRRKRTTAHTERWSGSNRDYSSLTNTKVPGFLWSEKCHGSSNISMTRVSTLINIVRCSLREEFSNFSNSHHCDASIYCFHQNMRVH